MQNSSGKKLGSGFRYCLLIILLICATALFFTWYLCSGGVCYVGNTTFSIPKPRLLHKILNFKKKKSHDTVSDEEIFQSILSEKTEENILDEFRAIEKFDFDIRKNDVIVFLHIQNSGGNVFARHIVEDLDLERPCVCKKNRKMCHCYRPRRDTTWLFSRYTTGWKCGVHPDWTELKDCVDRIMDEEDGKPIKRRYFFISLLRDPITRFLSEYWHFKQGRSWHYTRHWCGNKEVSIEELPMCFNEDETDSVTIKDYLNCPHNLAINRQTRMLADLGLVGCYNKSFMPKTERDLVMLTSAKNNLHKMAFFGLSEFPKISQYMFEETFALYFRQKESLHSTLSYRLKKSWLEDIDAEDIEKIKHINDLDMQLYQYAKDILFYRFQKLKNIDPQFETNFKTVSKTVNMSWAESEDLFETSLQ